MGEGGEEKLWRLREAEGKRREVHWLHNMKQKELPGRPS